MTITLNGRSLAELRAEDVPDDMFRTNTGELRIIENRCTFVRKADGSRCRKFAMTGLTVCKRHGGSLPYAAAKSAEARTVAVLKKNRLRQMVTPIAEDHPQADVAFGLMVEYRRTVAGVLYFDEKIAELDSEDDLTYGVSRREDASEDLNGFTEKGGVDTQKRSHSTEYRTEMNVLYKSRMEERKHLVSIAKLWISAGLAREHLQLEQQTVLMLNEVIVTIVRGLGKDVNDPDVRNIVRMALVALPSVKGAQTPSETIEG